MKTAVVTGANRGLGLAASKALAEKGYEVLMTARRVASLDDTCLELKARGLSVFAIGLDVTNPDDIARLKKAVTDRWNKLNVLINNAGVYPEKGGPVIVEETDPLRVREAFETNALGAFRVSQALIPALCKSGHARIVNVSSGLGQLSSMQGEYPGYRMSKAALNVLTRVLSAELKESGVLVNSVCPGWVRTDMGGPSAHRSIEQGVFGIVWAATLPDDGPTGGFFRDASQIPW